MVNVTTSDILTEQRIRRVVEEEQEHVLLWNELFRTLNLPDDWPTDTMEIPSDDAVMGQPSRIQEGSEFPREEEDYSKETVTVQKYGHEVSVSWESELFSVFDIVAQQVEKAARRMGELINEKAFDEVNNNLHANSPVSGSGTLVYDSVVDARKEILDSKYTPQAFIVNTQGEADLLKSPEFTRASDLGDDTITEGVIGRIAGLDVMVDNSGLLSDTQAEGIIADPNDYGYEVVKRDVATEEYEAPERQARIFQIYTMRAWKAINSDAAIKVTE